MSRSRTAGLIAAFVGAALAALFAASSTAATAAAPPPYVGGPKVHIAGGEPVTTPSPAVAVYANTLDEFRCGGTLTRPDEVVTAAHCVADLPNDQNAAQAPHTSERFFIRAGSTDRTAGQVHEVVSVDLHRDFGWQQINAADIAVLRLAVAVPGVEPAELGEIDPDQPVTVQGWGHTGPTLLPPPFPAPPAPTGLSRVDMRLVDLAHCQDPSDPLSAVPGELCLVPTKLLSGPCPGDSGSGGLQGRKLVAVVSRGPEPCGLGVGGETMTSVGLHMKWVQEMAGLGAVQPVGYQRLPWKTPGLPVMTAGWSSVGTPPRDGCSRCADRPAINRPPDRGIAEEVVVTSAP